MPGQAYSPQSNLGFKSSVMHQVPQNIETIVYSGDHSHSPSMPNMINMNMTQAQSQPHPPQPPPLEQTDHQEIPPGYIF